MTAGHLREALRAATRDVHERLHRHPGLAAVADATISRADYRRLLERLWGFHAAFEQALSDVAGDLDIDFDARRRSPLLAADLATLGLAPAAIARLPLCDGLSTPRGEAECLGALYVVEGSTLGGAQLARAVAPLVGTGDDAPRRFFLGRGSDNGALWRAFLARLDALPDDSATRDALIAAATRTFTEFERWIAAWKQPAANATTFETTS